MRAPVGATILDVSGTTQEYERRFPYVPLVVKVNIGIAEGYGELDDVEAVDFDASVAELGRSPAKFASPRFLKSSRSINPLE